MRIAVTELHRDRYMAPEAEVFIIKMERSFLGSGDNDDDNEHTEEEDLF